jgi:tripartite-type tricarboxylate transporter receptor subunit TctC
MNTLSFRLGRWAVLGVLASGCWTPAFAGEPTAFPTHNVTIVVPFPAGGATDQTARIMAEGLSKKWGQSVIVDNRPGAGGMIGSEFVARSAPDGHTIVLGVTGSHSINTSLYAKMRYHPLKDFKTVTQATLYPNAIVVHPSVTASGLQDLLKLLKAAPDKYAYGSDGNGTASHLGMALILRKAGVQITHIPYRGSTPLVTDLIGGQILVGMTGLPAVMPFVNDGQLKLIAITTGERFASAPNLPTVAEQGFPGYSAAPWSGFFVPADTPQALVDKMSTDMREVMNDPTAREKIVSSGNEFTPSTPEQFREFVTREIDKWADAVKISGAKVN